MTVVALVGVWRLLILSVSILGPRRTTAVPLRIAVRQQTVQNVPSCQHRIAHIEILNRLSTEDIVIRSIKILREETVDVSRRNVFLAEEHEHEPTRDENNPAATWVYDDLPRQLYVTKMPDEGWRLGPEQVITVPIAFLPRFPAVPMSHDQFVESNMNGCDDESSSSSGNKPRTSPYQEADWWDIVTEVGDSPKRAAVPSQERIHRNNQETESPPYPDSRNPELYIVSTIVVIETDRGILEVPFRATSIRENSFGLPDVIYFDAHSGEKRNKSSLSQKANAVSDDDMENGSFHRTPLIFPETFDMDLGVDRYEATIRANMFSSNGDIGVVDESDDDIDDGFFLHATVTSPDHQESFDVDVGVDGNQAAIRTAMISSNGDVEVEEESDDESEDGFFIHYTITSPDNQQQSFDIEVGEDWSEDQIRAAILSISGGNMLGDGSDRDTKNGLFLNVKSPDNRQESATFDLFSAFPKYASIKTKMISSNRDNEVQFQRTAVNARASATTDSNLNQHTEKNRSVAWIVDSQILSGHIGVQAFSDDAAHDSSNEEEGNQNNWYRGKLDCYDLFFQNPDSAALLKVMEVRLTIPHNISLHLHENQQSNRHQSNRYQQSSHGLSKPQEIVNDWSNMGMSKTMFGESYLEIPSDGLRHYLVTICAHTEGVLKDNNSTSSRIGVDSSTSHKSYTEENIASMADSIDAGNVNRTLGFLQIRTSDETLFVGLEKADEMSNLMQTRHISKFPVDSSHFRRDNQCDPLMSNVCSSPEKRCSQKDLKSELGGTSVQFSPSLLEFRFVMSSVPSATLTLNLTNLLLRPIVMMRSALALQQLRSYRSPELRWSSKNERKLLNEIGIGLRLKLHSSLSSPIDSGTTVVNAVSVTCSIDWQKFLSSSAGTLKKTLRGALVLRGTTRVDWSYSKWEKEFITDSDVNNFAIEVPFQVKIFEGSVGVLIEGSTLEVPAFWSMTEYSEELDIVSAAFFPSDPSFAMSSLTNEEKRRVGEFGLHNGATHQFRLITDIKTEVYLDDVAVVAVSSEVLSESICNHFDAYVVERGESSHIDLGELTNLGLVYLRYRFNDGSSLGKVGRISTANSSHEHPSTCYLRVTTQPKFGIHDIPLVVYTGRVSFSGSFSNQEVTDVTDNTTEPENERWYQLESGFYQMTEWFLTSKAGFALRSVLKASAGKMTSHDQDVSLLEQYLFGLLEEAPESDEVSLSPVLLKIGAIAQNETETLPLYITNLNPVPVTIVIDVGEVEGQRISIGKDFTSGKGDDKSLLDLFPIISSTSSNESRARLGRFRDHPLNGLRQFLARNTLAMKFLNHFPFRDDISASKSALSRFPFLAKKFEVYSTGHFHTSARSFQSKLSGKCKWDHPSYPSLYGTFQKKLGKSNASLLGPVIISNDRKTVRQLDKCFEVNKAAPRMRSDGDVVLLPPGGVVRFDVSIRSPPHEVLTKDITRFLSTGLVLKTDHGEVIPIVVAFEALQGKLDVSQVSSVREHEKLDSTIEVHAGLFEKSPGARSPSITIPPHVIRPFEDFGRVEQIIPRNVKSSNKGVSLFMKSSFLRDVRLRKVESCNPWFEVDLVNQTSIDRSDPFLGIDIGTIRSVIACDAVLGVPQNNTLFPSFFRCALNWLLKRGELQPRGCGFLPAIEFQKECKDSDYLCEKGGMEKTIRTLKRALFVSEWTDEMLSSDSDDGVVPNQPFPVKSGRRGQNGLVSPLILEAVSRAWVALQSASEAGLLSLGTSLRAVVEYNATPEEISPVKHDTLGVHESNHLLSVAIRNVSIKTSLETPILLNVEKNEISLQSSFAPQIVSFQPTRVAQVTAIKLPIRNPSAVPIRVRLAVSPTEFALDGFIRFRYLGLLQPPFVQVKRSSAWSQNDLEHEQWWDRGGAYFLPDMNGDMIRSPYIITIKSGVGARVSLVNPTFTTTAAFATGCGARCGIRSDGATRKPTDAGSLEQGGVVGASAAAGMFFGRRERALSANDDNREIKGISVDAGGSLLSGGKGPVAFAIPFSALDEVIVPPFGEAEIGPILFRPPGRHKEMGCESLKANRKVHFCETQMFESIVFLENSLTGLERVIIQGKALWEKVIFLDPFSSDGFGSIEQRNGLPTLMFPGQIDSRSDQESHPTVKEVIVHNEGDVPMKVVSGYLSPVLSNRLPAGRHFFNCELNHFRLDGCLKSGEFQPFILDPGHNRSLFIEHFPQCTKKRDFVLLKLQLESENKASQNEFSSGWPFVPHFTANGNNRPAGIFSQQIELSIGYEMSDDSFSSCKPFVPKGRFSTLRSMTGFWYSMASFLIALWMLLLRRQVSWLRSSGKKFCCALDVRGGINSDVKLTWQLWSKTFWYLARADPTSSDLKSLARELTLHVVLDRYNVLGITPPSCFKKAGVSLLDRVSLSGAPRRQIGAVTGGQQAISGTKDRIRTSDAIFGKLTQVLSTEHGISPLQLGWRTAATRGIIDASSLRASYIELKSEALLQRQRNQPTPMTVQSLHDHEEFDDKSLESSSDFASSLGDMSDEDNTTTASVKQEAEIPESISTAVRSKRTESVNQQYTNRIENSDSSEAQTKEGLDVGHTMTNSQHQTIMIKPEQISQPNSLPERNKVVKSQPKEPSKEERQRLITIENDASTSAEKIEAGNPLSSALTQSTDAIGLPVSGLNNNSVTLPRVNKTKLDVRSTPKRVVKQSSNQGTTTLNKKTLSKSTAFDDRKSKVKEKPVESKRRPETILKATRDAGMNGKNFLASKQSKKAKESLSTLQSDSTHVEKIHSPSILRPPPGLLPPPGFDTSPKNNDYHQNMPFRHPNLPMQNSISAADVDVLHAAPSGLSSTSDLGNFSEMPVASYSENALLQIRDLDYSEVTRDPSEFLPIFGNILPSLPSPQSNNSREVSDFDVMDFLDGILNDGGNFVQPFGTETAGIVSSDAITISQAEPMIPNSPPESPPKQPFSSNPWATDPLEIEDCASSRAATYGISFDDSSERANRSTFLSILTPADIFPVIQDDRADKDNILFYANLLDE